jgi:hypothetical protein
LSAGISFLLLSSADELSVFEELSAADELSVLDELSAFELSLFEELSAHPAAESSIAVQTAIAINLFFITRPPFQSKKDYSILLALRQSLFFLYLLHQKNHLSLKKR